MRMGIYISDQMLIVHTMQKFLTRPGFKCSRASFVVSDEVSRMGGLRSRVLFLLETPQRNKLDSR